MEDKNNLTSGQYISEEELDQYNFTEAEKQAVREGTFNPDAFADPDNASKYLKDQSSLNDSLSEEELAEWAEQKAQSQDVSQSKSYEDLTEEEKQHAKSLFGKFQAAFTNNESGQTTNNSEANTNSESSTTTQNEKQESDKELGDDSTNDTCPNCNWRLNEDPSEATENDKTNFRRSIVTGTDFQKTYELFNGDLAITFRTRPVKIYNWAQHQVSSEVASGELPSEPWEVAVNLYQNRLQQLLMMASLVSLTNHASSVPSPITEEWRKTYPPTKDKNSLAVAFDEIFENMSQPLYTAVIRSFLSFEALSGRLTEAATSPDFWEQTASVT